MVDEEKLKNYSSKYEEIKESVLAGYILKCKLESQQEISDTQLIKLNNDINDEKASVWFKKARQLREKADYLKKKFKIEISVTALITILLISLGYFVAELPLALVSVGSIIISSVKTVHDVKKYNKNIRKCSIANINDNELKSNEITRLEREHDNELVKNNDIKKSIEIVNNRLNNLGSLKIDIENLIICLFSDLDNIIKNKSNEQNPYATWLNISYVDDEPKLEINDSLKIVR